MNKTARTGSERKEVARLKKTLVEEDGQVAAAREQRTLDEDLTQLRSVLERLGVEEARELIEELKARWPDSDQVRHYARVLSPPVSRPRPDLRVRELDQEHTWLRKHAHHYPGCWIAVFEGTLLAADPSFTTVLEKARQRVGAGRAFLHFQPKPADLDEP